MSHSSPRARPFQRRGTASGRVKSGAKSEAARSERQRQVAPRPAFKPWQTTGFGDIGWLQDGPQGFSHL